MIKCHSIPVCHNTIDVVKIVISKRLIYSRFFLFNLTREIIIIQKIISSETLVKFNTEYFPEPKKIYKISLLNPSKYHGKETLITFPKIKKNKVNELILVRSWIHLASNVCQIPFLKKEKGNV